MTFTTKTLASAATVLALAMTATALAEDGFYVKQDTWAASMLATRRRVGQLQLRDIRLSRWFGSQPIAAKSLADELFPQDKVDRKTRSADRREVLHEQHWWPTLGDVHVGNPKGTARYIWQRIDASAAETTDLSLGCDSPCIVWLNDRKIYESDASGKFVPGQVHLAAALRKGANELRMKIFCPKGDGVFQLELAAAKLDATLIYEQLYRRFWKDWAETDWFGQDNPLRPAGRDDLNPRRDFGWYFEPSRDTTNEQKMIRRALDELGPAGTEMAAKLAALAAANKPADDPAWLGLYVDACRARRTARLTALAGKVQRVVFTKHYTMGGSHYAYTEGQSDAQSERNFVRGSALCLAEIRPDGVRVETLLDSPEGVLRDPDVSFDAKRVLFAWKKTDRKDDYHLYEMDLATRKVRQLTSGLGAVDYEGAYLPDGDIVFNSTRCVQTVDCWWTEVSNLYRCDADGRYMRRLAFDQVHDNYPTVTDDGRVLYTRWEYNDRGQVYPQPLLQMNPDGTGQMDFYGGNSWFPTSILHARGIPGTRKVLAIASGHHSRQTGKLIVLDAARGLQENEGAQLVAPPRPTPSARVDAYGQDGELFQYPYPLSETECLVAYHPVGWKWSEGSYGPRFGLYYMTLDGRRERLADDATLPCGQPVPVRPRPTAMRASTVDYSQPDGTCYIQDVYQGPGLSGIPRGTARTLRVVALDFRAAGVGSNGNGGPGGGALISTPVAIGNGSWDPKIILGDATVQADGSAFFRVPARTPFYFQVLDANGDMIQTMRSWTTLQPGENASCVGCHESKHTAPLARGQMTTALAAGAETMRDFYGPARGFSFLKEIQPILDRHCIRCHTGEKGKPFSLLSTGVPDVRALRTWTQSYLSLTHAHADDAAAKAGWRGESDHRVVNWVSAQSAPPMLAPYAYGAARSKLIAIHRAGHNKVRLRKEEMDKLAAWIDLGVPFCGDYVEANTWSQADREKYEHFLAKRQKLAAEEKANIEALIRK